MGHVAGRVRNFLLRRRRRGAFAAVFLSGAIFWTSNKLLDASLDYGTSGQGAAKLALLLVVLAIALLALAGYLVANRQDLMRPASSLPLPSADAAERLRIIPIDTLPLLRDVQERLVPAIFGEITPADAEIYKAHERNQQRSIGLYSDDEQRLVGFASCWPLTDEAATAIKAGTLPETELAEHILERSSARQANTLLVPAVGVLDAESLAGRRRGRTLMPALREFVYDLYLDDQRRSIEILAVAGSGKGREWCEFLGMTFVRLVDQGDGTMMPLFSKVVCTRRLIQCNLECD